MTTNNRPACPRNRPDIVVIGGGLHGLSACIHLTLAGYRCTVLEKDYPGRHASGVNAGGVRRLGRHRAEIPLSVAAMDYWRSMTEWVGDDCGFVACGQVKVAETENELSQLRQRVDGLNSVGFGHEAVLDRRQLGELVPSLSPHCLGAAWCADDGAANPYRTVIAFRRRALGLGVIIHSDCAVVSVGRQADLWRVRTRSGEFEAPIIVNAAGAWGSVIAGMIGDPVPMRIEALMLMITERVKSFLGPVLGATGRTLSFKQFGNGTVLIGGGHLGHADRESNKAATDPRGLSISARTVQALFPCMNDIAVNRFWAGLEGVTPDGIPVIGSCRNAENAYHVFGFCGHGFQLSPVTGRLLAELIQSGKTSLSIEPFRVDRFGAD